MEDAFKPSRLLRIMGTEEKMRGSFAALRMTKNGCRVSKPRSAHHGEQGFMLLWAIVAVFLVLLAIGIAAPRVARDLRRDKEVETIHRGNQYVRAIQLYYTRLNSYPGSIDALKNTNNTRWLRKEYVDPMTGEVDWKPILLGQAKTTPKGFFGEPLSAMPGNAAPGTTLAPSTPAGSSTSPDGKDGKPGSTKTKDSLFGSSGPGGGGPFVGVSIPKTGDSITVLNEMTTYDTWEFVYDPRVDQFYINNNKLNGGGALGGGLPDSNKNKSPDDTKPLPR